MFEEERKIHYTSKSLTSARRVSQSIGISLPMLWARNQVGKMFAVMMEGDVVLLVPSEKADEYREKFQRMVSL